MLKVMSLAGNVTTCPAVKVFHTDKKKILITQIGLENKASLFTTLLLSFWLLEATLTLYKCV